MQKMNGLTIQDPQAGTRKALKLPMDSITSPLSKNQNENKSNNIIFISYLSKHIVKVYNPLNQTDCT